MDYEHYERMKEMFIKVWPVLVPKMLPISHRERSDEYTVESTYGSGLENYILRIYGGDGIGMRDMIFELSFNCITKYVSTFTDDSIRIAHWKRDWPRLYALKDPSNAPEGSEYTMIEFPCDTDYFFLKSTAQETLEYIDYEFWDTESTVMSVLLDDHPSLSVGLVLRNNSLTPEEVLSMCIPFLDIVADMEKNNVE